MNKIGVAIDTGGIDHDKLSCALTLLNHFEITPHAYACGAAEFPLLLGHLLHTPRAACKTALRQQNISEWGELPKRTAVCTRDLQTREVALIGSGFLPVKMTSVLRFNSNFPLLRCGKKLLLGNDVPRNALFYALNRMGCEKYILLCGNTANDRDKARYLYWDISSYEQMLGDQSRINQFLYF